MGKEKIYELITEIVSEDQGKYTSIYHFVRQALIDALTENKIFKELFCDLSLCDINTDNQKSSRSDEYDFIMRLELPLRKLVIIERDPDINGNVYINLSDVLGDLWKEKSQEDMYSFLNTMVNGSGYFLPNKFENWLESCIVNYLTKINCTLYYSGQNLEENRSERRLECTLNYTKQEESHNICVMFENKKFSFDFVAGFRFTADTSKAIRPFMEQYWEAVPGSKNTQNSKENLSFRCLYTDSENALFKDKTQFENTLRLMKKFRDIKKLWNLRNYYIKTIFLHKLTENEDRNKPNGLLIDEIFENLEKALQNREIKSFWDYNLNLLEHLKMKEIDEIYTEVKNTRQILLKAEKSDEILKIFIAGTDQENMTAQTKEQIEKTWLEQVLDYSPSAQTVAIGSAVVVAGATLLWGLLAGSKRNNRK